MANERDAKLLISAVDKGATRTFEQVGKAVRDATDALKANAAAAAAGEGSIEDYVKVFSDLKDLGDDLGRQKSAIEAFQKTGAAVEAVTAKLTAARTEYDAYVEVLRGKGKLDDPPKKLATLAAAVERVTVTLDKAKARSNDATTTFNALGLSATDASAQLATISERYREVGEQTIIAARQVDGFGAAQKAAAAAAKTASEAAAESARTIAREETAAAAAARQRTDALLRQSGDVIRSETATAAAFVEFERQLAEVGRSDSLRKIAADADEASRAAIRLSTTTGDGVVGLSRLADAVRSIVTPTLSEVQSLDGALKQIDASTELTVGKQKRRTSEYQDALNNINQANAALVRQAGNIDAFNKQRIAVDLLTDELGKASTQVRTLAAELASAPADSAKLERALATARAEEQRIAEATQAANKKFVEQKAALEAAGVETNDLNAAYGRLEAGARKGAAAAEILTTKVGGGAGGKGFLGLKSYELTNLGYQINDVFTSLASGISPVQTLAQQGPQIAQLFPNILLGAVRLLPVLAPLAAAFGTIAYNIYEAKRASDALAGFENLFTLSGNAAGLSADQFAKAQLRLEDLKVSADDAKKVLREFIDNGLDATQLDNFVSTVKVLADTLGISITEAATKYGDALSGGYEQVVALNDITHTLTDTELAHIQTLFDEGKAQEARTAVAEAYRAKAQEIADKSSTEWSRATEGLSRAFSGLNDQLNLSQASSAVARIAVKNLTEDVRIFTGIVNAAKSAFQGLISLSKKLNGDQAAETAKYGLTDSVTRQNDRIKNSLPTVAPKTTSGGQSLLRDQQTQLKNAKILTAAQRLATAEADAANKAATAGANNLEIAQARVNARKIEQAKLDKEAETRGNKAASAARSAESKAASAARAAESRQNKINGLVKDLANTYDSLSINKADDPFAAIQTKAEIAVRNIRAKFAELAKLGITKVDGKTQADFEKQVAASAALETQQARQKQNEEDVNKLLEQRRIVLADIEARTKAGEITPLAGLDESQAALARINPQITAAAQQALAFATSLRTAEFDPKLESFIAKLQSTLRETAGNRTFVEIALGDVKQAQTELDALVARRDELISLQQKLVEVGLKSSADARKAIEKAFTDSQPAILAAADAVEVLIKKLLSLPGLSAAARAELTSLLSKLPIVRAQTKALDEDVLSLKRTAQSALTDGIATFLESLGSTIAEVLTGTKSLKDALSAIGDAALKFAADFVKAIAKAIIQLVAFKIAQAALQAVGFGFHDGGVVGSSQPTFTRRVSPLAFAGAIRYHSGGLVGLRPDEVPAILQKGEEVITANDPRHRRNGGGAAAPAKAGDVKIVNLFDAGEAVSQGANTLAGERAILNVIRQNPSAVREAVGRG